LCRSAGRRRAVELVRQTFDNFNLDLMYALPGQRVEDVTRDIVAALGFDPPHLSVYHLTIEPNTYFHRYPPKLPDDDSAADMQDHVERTLEDAGYEHYETSAYAKPGRRSRHNLNYWTFGDYLGLGAGAHGKLSFPDRIVRQARWRQPAEYMSRTLSGAAVQSEHDVGGADIGFEFMMNALRLSEGFATALFEERTGMPLTTVLPNLDEAERRGFIVRDHQRVAPTVLGRRFLNDLLQIFVPERGQAARGD
jgi:oxygen-independent coproporphyrinogen-3 oxidase